MDKTWSAAQVRRTSGCFAVVNENTAHHKTALFFFSNKWTQIYQIIDAEVESFPFFFRSSRAFIMLVLFCTLSIPSSLNPSLAYTKPHSCTCTFLPARSLKEVQPREGDENIASRGPLFRRYHGCGPVTTPAGLLTSTLTGCSAGIRG